MIASGISPLPSNEEFLSARLFAVMPLGATHDNAQESVVKSTNQ